MVKCNELVFKLFVRAYNWVIKRRSMDRGAGKWGLEAGGWRPVSGDVGEDI